MPGTYETLIDAIRDYQSQIAQLRAQIAALQSGGGGAASFVADTLLGDSPGDSVGNSPLSGI